TERVMPTMHIAGHELRFVLRRVCPYTSTARPSATNPASPNASWGETERFSDIARSLSGSHKGLLEPVPANLSFRPMLTTRPSPSQLQSRHQLIRLPAGAGPREPGQSASGLRSMETT